MGNFERQFQYTYDVGKSNSAVSRYCAKQFPFLRQSVVRFTIPAMLVYFAFALFGDGIWRPIVESIAALLGLPNSLMPVAAGVFVMFLGFLILRLIAPMRKAYLIQSYKKVVPEYPVTMDVGDSVIEWKWPGARSEFSIESIYAITKAQAGLTIGLGTSAVFVPNSAFQDQTELDALAKHLLKYMKPEAVSRSTL